MNQSHPALTRKATTPLRNSRSNSRQAERRNGYRTKVMKGIELDADVLCGFNMVWPGKAIDLSLQGILLEFPKNRIPSVRVEEKVSVKLRCHEDVVWVAGVVRHRHGNRLGVFFSQLLDQGTRSTEHTISRILKTIERGWLRKQQSS